MKRVLRLAAVVGLGTVAFFVAVAVFMRLVASDIGAWHVPLTAIERPSAPSDFLAATPGYTEAEPDVTLPTGTVAAADWLSALDAIALAEPRVVRLAGSPAAGRITWVQRSAVFGFPDYVTAEADENGRAIWSRARYGRSDFGVNGDRIRRWLARLGMQS